MPDARDEPRDAWTRRESSADMFTVGMLPRSNSNPYLDLYCDALHLLGVRVVSALDAMREGRHVDVVHVHWPEAAFNSSRCAAEAVARAVRVHRRVLRFCGDSVPLVWTAHNDRSHAGRYPRTEAQFWRWFDRTVSGVIFLSKRSRDEILADRPRLTRIPHASIPHGDFLSEFVDAPTRAMARHDLGLSSQVRLCVQFGGFHPDKNARATIRAFRRGASARDRLLLIGNTPDSVERERIERDAAGDGRIIIRFAPSGAFIPHREIVAAVRAADLVVAPFTHVTNSGSVMFALSACRPVLASALGSIPEIAEQVGKSWLQLLEGDLEWSHIERCLNRNADASQCGPDLTPFEWPTIAGATIKLYRAAIAHHTSRCQR